MNQCTCPPLYVHVLEGDQDIPPQNIPLWPKDHFELGYFKETADIEDTQKTESMSFRESEREDAQSCPTLRDPTE